MSYRPSAPAMTDRRLGVFVDCPFAAQDGQLSVHSEAFGFVVFVEAVASNFSSHTYFGRRSIGAADLVPLESRGDLHSFPGYQSLTDLSSVMRSLRGTVKALWQGIARVDVVWVFGPHPFALLLVAMAMIRRRRVVLGVRQDTRAYFRSRLPGRRWIPALAPVAAMDWLFRAVAMRTPTTVVGRPIAEAYRGPRPGVLEMAVTLIRDADRRPAQEFGDNEPVQLLSVGRLSQEKNPLLLLDTLHELDRREPGRYSLTWIGSGPLLEVVRARAFELGLQDTVDLPGFVPFGPELLARYANAGIFVHTSLTEGSPQVLHEAAALSLPIVATDVGGVKAAMDDGRAAILVPPKDLAALTEAIGAVANELPLRRRLAEHAGALSDSVTMESESVRVASFVAGVTPVLRTEELV